MKTDCLIIGGGIAGLISAYELAKAKLNVVILTRLAANDSNSYLAQGGIIYKGKNDRPDLLAHDIEEAGNYLCNKNAVSELSTMGPKLVEEILIKELQTDFSHNEKNELNLSMESAHKIPRIIYKNDQTGKVIIEKLLQKLKSFKNIKILSYHTAIDLLTLSHHSKNVLDIYKYPTCIGAYVLDQKKKEIFPILARETILATGGIGRLFLHTTNSEIARGDGIAMAFRAGVRILNLEYIQFHPTTFYKPYTERFLISEALRGNGARLINKKGDAFMVRYHKSEELAPRDVVARAIHNEIMETSSDCVYLDISFKDKDWIKARFPHIYKRCLENGYDITEVPIPVVPAAHYLCGGIYVNNIGETTMRGLSSVGEVSCTGLHGGNRLASTSLLEGLVCGVNCARNLASKIKKEKYYFPQISSWSYENENIDPALIYQDWELIKQTMTNYVGLVRSTKRLYRAYDLLNELNKEIERFYANAKISDELIGLRNASLVSTLIVKAAKQNRHSIGCHYRVD
jgi:L-aspartate oxidase